MEALLKLQNHLGKDCFDLKLRLSEGNSQRWTEEFVTEAIENQKNLQKVWVCGPPLMNENFEKYLRNLEKKEKINMLKQVEIM